MDPLLYKFAVVNLGQSPSSVQDQNAVKNNSVSISA